ncbi:class I glutamine amidotransferase-like protein [Periconia macrospinosa]|uniref:Class I glutamine amidotransferase-like protein n=1 Tax=Periconia macrospinosa TaxID=97972 RepID=A0A2V1DQE2_9PLEO|nr:class I glutamine amidotransferase-like protein [Periconia macrospinosa]
MSSLLPSPRVAIVRNYQTQDAWGQQMLDSIADLAHKSIPHASIHHFQPIEGGDLPSVADFDLIILTGGTLDLSEVEILPWAKEMIEWLHREVPAHPNTKWLGFCWGHQVLARAFGGTIVFRHDGALIGVESIGLLKPGRDFFGGSQLLLHKFHKRVIGKPPEGFTQLAERWEIMRSDSNQILSFQAHPELDEKISRGILDSDETYRASVGEEATKDLERLVALEHDGADTFHRVMKWALC